MADNISQVGRSCGPCYHCKSDMWLPYPLYEAAKRSDKITFYCAYGHPQVFAQGESDLEKMRRERDRLLQRTVQLDEARVEAERRLATAQNMLNRQGKEMVKARKRAKAGTCPCCHRTFRQMALHMAKQHPEFKADLNPLASANKRLDGEAA